jgi:peptidoglycan/LPS O-acetylase OafA/YrhL
MATAPILVAHPKAAEAARPRPYPAQIPELDGVRGIAVLLVMICHSAMWLPLSPLRSLLVEGRIGVDLFFVLSGFLITGILLDTQRDRRALRNFYIRRGLRIWPLYFAFLLIAFLALRRMVPPWLSPWAYVLFMQNFLYSADIGPVLDPTWSLAVEEQFYLIWPWIALRARRKTLLKICCGVIAISPLIRCGLHMAGASDTFIYVNTLSRLDGIAMGGAIAAWIRSAKFDVQQLRRVARVALPVGTFGAVICYFLGASNWIATELGYSFIALAFGGVLAFSLAAQGSASRTARLLRGFTLSRIGSISFALYLFNLPIYTVMHGRMASGAFSHFSPLTGAFARLVAENLVLLAAAILSWKLYEGPILRLKSRWAPRRSDDSKPIQQAKTGATRDCAHRAENANVFQRND